MPTCFADCQLIVKENVNADGSRTNISLCSESAPTQIPAKKPCPPGMAKDPPKFCTGRINDCMDLLCVQFYLKQKGKNLKTNRLVRKEYRMLTDDERNAFHQALLEMKLNGVFDRLAEIHAKYSDGLGGAHYGAAFLPWHREFIKRFSFKIKKLRIWFTACSIINQSRLRAENFKAQPWLINFFRIIFPSNL